MSTPDHEDRAPEGWGWATPRIVSRVATAVAVALVVSLLVWVPGALRAAEPDAETMERAVVDRVNALRRERQRAALRVDDTLTAIAREYSCGLARRETLSHSGPGGQSVGDRVRAAGKRFKVVGENLASNTNARDPVAAAIEGWMRSPGHRDNILDPAFTETGVGVCRAGKTVYFTQVFVRPADSR